MKAYLLSVVNGTVQIGDTVFQPCNNISFNADRTGLQNLPAIDVKDKSMDSAGLAIQQWATRGGV